MLHKPVSSPIMRVGTMLTPAAANLLSTTMALHYNVVTQRHGMQTHNMPGPSHQTQQLRDEECVHCDALPYHNGKSTRATNSGMLRSLTG